MVSGLHFYLCLSNFFHNTHCDGYTGGSYGFRSLWHADWRSHRSDHWPTPPPETQLPLSVGSTLPIRTHCGQAWASKHVCVENEATEHVFITLKNFTAEELNNWIRPCSVYWQSQRFLTGSVCVVERRDNVAIYTLCNKLKIPSFQLRGDTDPLELCQERQTCGNLNKGATKIQA